MFEERIETDLLTLKSVDQGFCYSLSFPLVSLFLTVCTRLEKFKYIID